MWHKTEIAKTIKQKLLSSKNKDKKAEKGWKNKGITLPKTFIHIKIYLYKIDQLSL